MGWQGADVARRQRAERARERAVDKLVDAVRARRQHPTTGNDQLVSDALDEYDTARAAVDAR